MNTSKSSSLRFVFAFLLAGLVPLSAADYSWQTAPAQVSPTGDLEWAPESFEFRAGDEVRYIDYAGGDDSADGASPDTAWKHHPWDKNAGGRAAAADDGAAVTYVFKGGVEYRGALSATGIAGTGENPIRLTRDPSWGEGPATFLGSTNIGGSGWERATASNSPDGLPLEDQTVWTKQLDKKNRPWAVWHLDGQDVNRMPLARHPNWEIDDWHDVKSQWFQWEDGKRVRTGSKGIDTKNLTEDPEFYEDALLYTEWGFVMSTPVALPVLEFDPEKKSLRSEGFFTPKSGGRQVEIEGGMRYYLANKPHYLDAPGEWYFDDKTGRIYMILPEGVTPADARIEAGTHKTIIDVRDVENLEISGLTFHFTDLFEFGKPGFRIYEDEHEVACVRMQGNIANATVRHNVFQYINTAVVTDVDQGGARGENILIADNDVSHTDYAAFTMEQSTSEHPGSPNYKEGPFSEVYNYQVLRNRCFMTGMLPTRGKHGHTITAHFPKTAEFAGNILDRPWGAGLFVFGGKRSGNTEHEIPFTRILIHHNKVTNSLLHTNDWGGIETWQGGPFYLYSNISGNPGGYRHWRWLRQKDSSNPGHVGTRFGHAYYMDGAFKNYHFNNIAWGLESDLRSPLMNTAAFQEIHGFENNAFHNTAYMFGAGSRRQTPEPGRNLYLGNVWSHISDIVFTHGNRSAQDVNAADVGVLREFFEYDTIAYDNNVFYDIGNELATFEATGESYQDPEKMAEALKKMGAYESNVGVMASSAPLADPAKGDFRPAPGSAAIDSGVKAFVPWSLYATVGEWHFLRNNQDPSEVIDNHWYMTRMHANRSMYEDLPTWPLHGENIAAGDYVSGPLEDWTPGALKLDGRDQFLRTQLPGDDAANAKLAEIQEPVTEENVEGWFTITRPSAISPGVPYTITIETADSVPADHRVQTFLGARKHRGYAGTHATPAPEDMKGYPAGQGKIEFTLTPKDAAGLSEYVVYVFHGEEPGWDNKEKGTRVTVPYVPAAEIASSDQFKTPDIGIEPLLIETYAKIEPGATGLLAGKKEGDTGYSLMVTDGGRLSFAAGNGDRNAEVVSTASVADGDWHHIVAELDREAGKIRLYLNGALEAEADGLGADVSLSNNSELFVGGTPNGANLAVTLDFLRVCRGTLDLSRTTIEELTAWQTDGPFLRDFTGAKPVGRARDAGAIEAR